MREPFERPAAAGLDEWKQWVSGQESRLERGWNWFLKVMGAGVFIYAATTRGQVAFGIAFIGISIAVLPIQDVRSLFRTWRRGGNDNDKPPTS